MFNAKFPARRRARKVNPAGNRLPQFSLQSNATWWLFIRPPHTDQIRGQQYHILMRYAFMPDKSATRKLGVMKIDPESGTAGSAGPAWRIVFRLACHSNLLSSIFFIPTPFLICAARSIGRCRSTPSRPRFPFDPHPDSAVRDSLQAHQPVTRPYDPSVTRSRKMKGHRPSLPE